MNTMLVRTSGLVMDGWPVLLTWMAYAMAFYIFATTITSISLVA